MLTLEMHFKYIETPSIQMQQLLTLWSVFPQAEGGGGPDEEGGGEGP